MPQNKLWDFWSKQTISQDIENPDKASQSSTSSGNEVPQDIEPSSANTFKANPEASEKDDSALIGESSEEWTKGLKGTLYSGLYFFFGSLVLIFFMNFTNARMPRGLDPLPDVGHELIPKMRPEKLGDITQVGLIVTFIVCMFGLRGNKTTYFLSTFINVVSQWPIIRTIVKPIHKSGNRWPIITKFLLTLGNLYLIRSISVFVTSVPATDNHCRYGYEDIPSIWMNTLKGLITLGSANIHCGDLMFSGHTCMVTNVWLTLNRNYKKNYIFRIWITIVWLLTFVFIIGTRSHYTIDIWIALWLTICVHTLTPSYFPFTKKNIRRVLGNFFYGNDAKAVN